MSLLRSVPVRESIFYHEGLVKAFIQYDPERANRILDEIGLNHRDREGFRTFPDRTRMLFYLDESGRRRSSVGEFVVDDWAKVGVRVILRMRTRRLFYVEKNARDFDFNVWGPCVEHMAIISPRYFIPFDTESFYAVGWARWYMKGGFYGDKAARESPSAIAVPTDHPMHHAIAAYEQAKYAPTLEVQKQHFKKVLDIAAENTWSIAIGTSPPDLAVVKNDFRNVPERILTTCYVQSPGNAGIETYFFEKPKSSPSVDREITESLLNPTPRPGGEVTEGTVKSGAGKTITSIIKYSVLVVVVLVILLISLHHPYICRRLLIMVPTLLIISVVAFTVIQLPPGDFLTAKLMQLQVSGDAQDMQAIEDLES
ncbi:MAG: hypothetical protein SVV80_01975, partial [Planctomycetota bacterium]|nr:hypothetical protein [Planctomycetota bacterium]